MSSMDNRQRLLPWGGALAVVIAIGWGHLFHGTPLVATGPELCVGMEDARFNSAAADL